MLSIFTPSHSARFLPDTYRSLLQQTDGDWQWLVLHNNGGRPFPCLDERVRQVEARTDSDWIGALKAEACEQCAGDLLLELDHDDMLAPTAVADVKEAFADERVGFVYSNAIYGNAQLAKVDRFADGNGWRYRETIFDGHLLDEPIAFEPLPSSLSRVWFAPDHLRAFRRETYRKAGGHDPAMRVLDDHDLMCRMYQHGEFAHVDKGLYFYRVHGGNAWLKRNKEIQENALRLHDKYIEPLALTWAARNGLRALDLGGAIAPRAGFESVDAAGADVNCDLEERWPFESSSVGVIRAADIFEHLRDPVHTMRECHRVLAPGGLVLAQVPSTDGRGAFQDPTHRSFWNENSWLYYTDDRWAKYIRRPVRFQAVRLFTTAKDAREVCWTVAHLVCLKGGARPPGQLAI